MPQICSNHSRSENYVCKDANDVTKRMTMNGTEAIAYQYTEAYEKQASFLTAQSRAMGDTDEPY